MKLSLGSLKQIFAWRWPLRVSRGRLLIGVLGVVACLGAGTWYWPQSVSFAYESKTCMKLLLGAPGVVQSVGKEFQAHPDRTVRLANLDIAAGGVCVSPVKAPQPGQYHVKLAPFGLAWLGKQVTVTVPSLPVASVAPLQAPVPVSRELSIPLSQTDAIFSYRLKVGEKDVECQASRQLRCGIEKLGLSQGATYPLRLDRYFKGSKVATVVARDIQTLVAVTVKDTSIKPNEMVFRKPRTIDVMVDKPLAKATVSLSRVDNNRHDSIPVTSSISGTTVTIKWADDFQLSRQADFKLTVDGVEATDGSTLVTPFILPFRTSGGPKVTSINVGSVGISQGSTAVITFDQPLQSQQDLTKAITLKGGAVFAGISGAKLSISLAQVPRCGDFAIEINDTLQSDQGVSGGSSWTRGGRIICHTVSSIGASVNGRPISAYWFGSGPTTVVYTGGIHGTEAVTRSLMLRWIDELEANARTIPADKTIVVIPALNPDGVAAGTRTNARNVDLNRNFATSDWRKDVTTVGNKPFPGGGGSTSMSEPETQAIAALISRLRPKVVLSYHSVGGIVAANQAGASTSFAKTYASLSGYGNVTGATSSTFDYSVSGTADDYYAEKLGVASVLIELSSNYSPQFEQNKQAMWTMMR